MAATEPARTPQADRPRTRPRLLLLNGPNLNLLGGRDPAVYGADTLADIEARVTILADKYGMDVTCAQHNGEGELIEALHAAADLDGVILNPGAYAHTSYALRDAIEAVAVPCVEVHISNVHAREPFRHTSVTAPVASGFLCGFGPLGYELAVHALAGRLGPA
jgi:3-dehydroquinate dehydratase-2